MFAIDVGKTCFLKRTINTAVYEDILDHFLIPYIEEKFENNEFVFQHDLAPVNPAKSTKEWFREKRILVLDWPVNPRENLGGNPLEEMRKHYPSICEDLKKAIIEVWAYVSPETCRDLIGSLPKQMKEIVNIKGATTKW